MEILQRSAAVAAIIAGAAGATARPLAAASQTGTAPQPELVPVVLWTIAALVLSMLVLSLGYLYRRTRGATDEVIPKYVEPEPGSRIRTRALRTELPTDPASLCSRDVPEPAPRRGPAG